MKTIHYFNLSVLLFIGCTTVAIETLPQAYKSDSDGQYGNINKLEYLHGTERDYVDDTIGSQDLNHYLLINTIVSKDLTEEQKLVELKYLCTNSDVDINMVDPLSGTALITAVYERLPAVVTFLLERKANANVKNCSYNQTPLHLAIEQGNRDIAIALINHGADVDAKFNYFGFGTPLHTTAKNAYHLENKKNRDLVEIATALIKHGANVNAIDNDRKTALHYSVLNGSLGMVKLLVKSGATGLKQVCFPNYKDSLVIPAYIELALAFYAAIGKAALFKSFAKNYLTTEQNIADIKDLLPIDKYKNFTRNFNEWCKKHKKTISPVNTNLNTITTTPNGLTNTNLCATMGNLSLNQK